MAKNKIISLAFITFTILAILLFIHKSPVEEEKKIKDNNGPVAYLIENEDGSYEKSDNSTWPTDMFLNANLSSCMNINGEVIDDVSFTFQGNKIKLSTNYSLKCYLYFSKKYYNLSVVLSDGTNTNVASKRQVKLTLTWDIDNADSYCITNEEGSCRTSDFKKTNGAKKVVENITLSGDNGLKTYYVYLKDTVGNIISSSASINLNISYNLKDICLDKTISSCLASNASDILEIANLNANQAGMYRYQGTNDAVKNNYLCFGTNSMDTCLSDTDKYMYRIIGITNDGKIKLIKSEALNANYQYHTNYSSNTSWPSTSLYSHINGTDFLNNTNYIPSGWKDKIVTYAWYHGAMVDSSISDLANVYNIETGVMPANWTAFNGTSWSSQSGVWNTYNAKIGLMYLHDYYYAGAKYGSLNNSVNASSWIFIKNADPNASYNLNVSAPSLEWFMSRVGSITNYGNFAYAVFSDGHVGRRDVSLGNKVGDDKEHHVVRPVFYLQSSTTIKEGSGTISNPYVIN